MALSPNLTKKQSKIIENVYYKDLLAKGIAEGIERYLKNK